MREGVIVEGLSVAYPSRTGWLRALDDVSFTIPKGGVLGLVGESGSGKSTVILALLGLLGPARLAARRLAFDGHDLLHDAPALRGRRIGIVFQDTAAALNPALTIGAQITEPMRVHLRMAPHTAWARATELLAETGIARPAQVMHDYPHQLSGGMKQRVGIATALATEPDLLLLDEPTTALDVTIEAQILALLDELRARRGLSMLLVSHNLGIVDRLAETVAVLYAGRVAETGSVADVLHHPRHPYTRGLLAALPRPDRPHAGRLAPIPGSLPDLTAPVPGCNFQPRCPFSAPGCEQPQPLLDGTACWRSAIIADTPWPIEPAPMAQAREPLPLLDAAELSASFRSGGLFAKLMGRSSTVLAIDRVSLRIATGEIVGLVGESGCGKSTLGRLLLRLIPADAGALRFGAERVPARPDQAFRRRAQIVFQNPDTSLNPRQTVGTILARAIRWFGAAGPKAGPKAGQGTQPEIDRLLALVRLPARYAVRYPHQLSGGEKQRVGIARALASSPDFLVCDEAVSALDVSVQAAILNLLRDLRDELGVAYLFISHDIGVIAHIADRVVVMYLGSIMEEGATADVLQPPYHPYTELLLSSVPLVGRHRAPVPRPAARPAPGRDGCKFAARCPRHLGDLCDTTPPPLRRAGPGHAIHCHIPLAELAAAPHWLTREDVPA